MQDGHDRESMGSPALRVGLVLLLSCLLHGGLWWWLQSCGVPGVPPERKATVHEKGDEFDLDWLNRVLPLRPEEEPKPVAAVEEMREDDVPKEEEKKRELPEWLKTTVWQRSPVKPDRVDFIGDRHTVASGGPKAPTDAALPMPAVDGREDRDELVLFDQERQDGDPETEGAEGVPGADVPMPVRPEVQPVPSVPQADRDSRVPTDPDAAPGTEGTPGRGVKDGDAAGRSDGEGEDDREQPKDAGVPEKADGLGEAIAEALLDGDPHLPDTSKVKPLPGVDDAPLQPAVPAPPVEPKVRPVVYDPSLPMSSQPGFRSLERRTVSRGNFAFGSRPALNVASTPLGRYEALIYRRIAAKWYPLTDSHRGDMKPGSLKVRILINEKGYVVSLDLLQRVGAGAIQQSLTYRAIRQAELPPMPPEVREAIVGDKLELYFNFYFD